MKKAKMKRVIFSAWNGEIKPLSKGTTLENNKKIVAQLCELIDELEYNLTGFNKVKDFLYKNKHAIEFCYYDIPQHFTFEGIRKTRIGECEIFLIDFSIEI